jgi:hypothetical protein
VKRGEETVVAGVICPEGDVLSFLWMGLPAEHIEAPPEGSISALYLFGIRYAFDRRCSAVDFTGTRAFLGDGALRFKRKWGARIEDTFSPSSILVRPRPNSQAAATFCERYPVLVRKGGGVLESLIVASGRVDAQLVAQLRRQYVCDGTRYLTVIGICEENVTSLRLPDADGCQCEVIHTSLADFAGRYVARSRRTAGADRAHPAAIGECLKQEL